MSLRELPARPSLEHLKNQAQTIRRQALAADSAAIARFAAFGVISPNPTHADALHIIAREYGFDTWAALKLHIEASSSDPVEALIAAIKANDAALLRQVLAQHPSLKSRINDPLPNYGFDEPAILSAVHKQDREMIDALLDFGANINQRSLWWAGSFGVLDFANPDLSTYLISRGAIIDIHSAARLGMTDRVRQFLDADSSLVHARGGDGQLPLHFAANIEIAALLLDHGAEVDARDIDHESTAAHYLVGQQRKCYDVVRYLISRGAQPDILMASAIGDLPLVESILNNDPETVRVTVNERYFPKQNPRSGGHIYIYGFGYTKSPHIIAHELGHTQVFDLLMQRSAPWLRLVQAAELDNEALVQSIHQQHPTIFTKLSSNAARRIIGVALRNNTRAVQLLLELGWPVDATLDNGQTALHFAAWHGNIDMLRLLLARNAPVNVFETEHGGSPLAWALHGSQNSWARDKGDYLAVTRALLAAGANIPQPEQMPLQATDDLLEIIHQHISQSK